MKYFFFIFGTILISLGHSCKIRIDYGIIALTILLYLGKIIYYYAYYHHKEKIYTTLYYYMFEYGKLMLNPLFNLPSFLIGMYFGLINYSIQRGISESNRDSDYSRICNNKDNEYEQKLTYKNTNRIFKANTDDDNDFARESINLDDEEEEIDGKKGGKIIKSNTELQKLEVLKKERLFKYGINKTKFKTSEDKFNNFKEDFQRNLMTLAKSIEDKLLPLKCLNPQTNLNTYCRGTNLSKKKKVFGHKSISLNFNTHDGKLPMIRNKTLNK